MRALSIIIGILMVLALAIPIQTYAWNSGHPDTCQPCHGAYGTTTDNINGQTYNFWNHQIEKGQNVWNNCVNCHTDYTQGTAHDNLGCQGCHVVAHIGYYDGNSYAVGLYYWELSNPNNQPLEKPGGGANLVQKKLILDQTQAATYIPNIQNYLGNSGQEVEVGVWDAFNNQFIETSGAGVDTPGDAFKVCFSCHFIIQDPSQIGSYMMVDGKWKIGIPAAALEMDPHYIYPISPENASSESSGGLPIFTIGLGLVGIALVALARHKLA